MWTRRHEHLNPRPIISNVERNTNRDISSVSTISGKWERIPIKIDSGAVDTVMPPHVANHFALVETDLSKSGPGFKAANGSLIKHFGQRAIRGIGDQYQRLHLTAQIADVKNTLGSVYQMVRAGNTVHFESGNCYVQHNQSGQRTPIEEKNGMFEIGIWVPRSPSPPVKPNKLDNVCTNDVDVDRSSEGF